MPRNQPYNDPAVLDSLDGLAVLRAVPNTGPRVHCTQPPSPHTVNNTASLRTGQHNRRFRELRTGPNSSKTTRTRCHRVCVCVSSLQASL